MCAHIRVANVFAVKVLHKYIHARATYIVASGTLTSEAERNLDTRSTRADRCDRHRGSAASRPRGNPLFGSVINWSDGIMIAKYGERVRILFRALLWLQIGFTFQCAGERLRLASALPPSTERTPAVPLSEHYRARTYSNISRRGVHHVCTCSSGHHGQWGSAFVARSTCCEARHMCVCMWGSRSGCLGTAVSGYHLAGDCIYGMYEFVVSN